MMIKLTEEKKMLLGELEHFLCLHKTSVIPRALELILTVPHTRATPSIHANCPLFLPNPIVPVLQGAQLALLYKTGFSDFFLGFLVSNTCS